MRNAPDESSDAAPESQGGAPDESINDSRLVAHEQVPVIVRRAPKYLQFGAAGAVFGVLAALVWAGVAAALPVDEEAAQQAGARITTPQAFALLAVFLAAFGAAIGLIVALVVDRALRQRAASGKAVRESYTEDHATAYAEDGSAEQEGTADHQPAASQAPSAGETMEPHEAGTGTDPTAPDDPKERP